MSKHLWFKISWYIALGKFDNSHCFAIFFFRCRLCVAWLAGNHPLNQSSFNLGWSSGLYFCILRLESCTTMPDSEVSVTHFASPTRKYLKIFPKSILFETLTLRIWQCIISGIYDITWSLNSFENHRHLLILNVSLHFIHLFFLCGFLRC